MGEGRPALFRGRHFREEIIVLCLRWYLRYPLSYRNLEEMVAERGLSVDHSTIAPLGAALFTYLERTYPAPGAEPEPLVACGRNLHPRRGSLDILVSGHRLGREHNCLPALAQARLHRSKTFLRLALRRADQIRPRVINVDGHPAYRRAIKELKRTGELGRQCRCRPSRYMNNLIEQDHRFVKKRIIASQWFRSVAGAQNTIAGYEAMNMIRKGQIRWLAKNNIVGQATFVGRALGIAA
jgi:IS6 family transposase